MSQPTSTRHWSWNYYMTDGALYRNNKSFKNAWCLACLNHHRDLLQQLEIVNTALTGTVDGQDGYHGCTDAEREAQGA
jgi:hypothetical protein